MTHAQIMLTRSKAQLNQLAQMRNRPYISKFDSQMISELFHHDADMSGPMTDKQLEMIQTLADRYLVEVTA